MTTHSIVGNASYVCIATDVIEEMGRAEAKFPDQHLPDGTTDSAGSIALADMCRAFTDRAAANGRLTWADVLAEEFYEAVAETDPALLRAELVQVAAVAQRWIIDIDTRKDRSDAVAEAV